MEQPSPKLARAQGPKDRRAKFGRYVVDRQLGEGAMGTVFLADDPVLERRVALKVIAVDPGLARGTRQEYLTRFATEAKASAKLNHPSIVQVYDAGDQDGVPWIAFQFVEGETLEDLLRRRGKLSIRRSLQFALDIAGALQHAHSWSIVHRDIKPANILVAACTGIAMLADFGVVKAPWAVMTREGSTLGSPGYMSPEQIEGGEIDERADIFSLGVVIYQMITGTHPFLRETVANTVYATCNGAYTSLREVVDTVPVALDMAVRKCLAADVNRRLRSAAELIELLGAVAPPDDGTRHETGRAAGAGASAYTSVSRASPGAKAVWLAATRGAIARFGTVLPDRISRRAAEATTALSTWLSGACNAARSPRIRSFACRVSSTLAELSRSPSRAALFWLSLAGVVVTALIVVVLAVGADPAAAPRGSREAVLTRQCEAALKANDRAAALAASSELTNITSLHPSAHAALARILLRNGAYEAAARNLVAALALKGGTGVLKRQRHTILDEIGRQLRKGPAPLVLVDLTVNTLTAGKDPVVRLWLRDGGHWLRWNAKSILEMSDVTVDALPLYVKDLAQGESDETKLRAVRELGAVNDPRALTALTEAAARGDDDPAVSREAQQVLDSRSWGER